MPRIARVAARNTTGYAVTLRAGRHDLVADEPTAIGGGDTGPSPYDLLLSALAACTAITLRMYAERKQWPLGDLGVRLTMEHADDGDRIDRVLTLGGDLTAEQVGRLLEIAERTPVTRTLREGVPIETRLQT